MYCQMSASVQLLSGKARTLSPRPTRQLYSDHNSGRCVFGSHNWLRSRNDMTRSLARLFSSSRRAPPMAQSKPCADRSEEHTSELQSLMRISYAVFCLKKKKKNKPTVTKI